jgi:4-carboxymuconolactone decarboxylase
MPRIPYPNPASLSESARLAISGNPVNVTRMLAAASEPVFKGFSAFGSALINGSPLPAKLREIAILRVGYLSHSKYEVFQHEALARHVGLTDEQIEAVRAGGSAAKMLEEAEAAVLAYVDDLVKNVRPSDETLNAVRKHLSDTELVDLTLVIGSYMMVCRFLEMTGIEIDPAPIDWKEMTPSDA